MVSRAGVVLGTLWVAGAVFATSVGLVAVQRVGNEVGDDVASPLSNDAVRKALVSATPATPHAEPEDVGTAEEIGPVRTVSTRGGLVSARCRDHDPALLYAAPADGYRTVRSEPDVVRFVGSKVQVVVRLSCDDEELVSKTTVHRVGSEEPSSPAPAPSRTEEEHNDAPSSEDSPEPHDSPDESSDDR
jgi:hypothetical protein